MWSADGRRLLVLSARTAPNYAANGPADREAASSPWRRRRDGALSPDGRNVALVLGGREVVVADASAVRRRPVRSCGVGAVQQLTGRPTGSWLLVSLPAANQWVFVRVAGTPRIQAVSRIAQQFSSGTAQGFPQLEGWCCTSQGRAG